MSATVELLAGRNVDRYTDPDTGHLWQQMDELETGLRAHVARKHSWAWSDLTATVRHAPGTVYVECELVGVYTVRVQYREYGPWSWFGGDCATPDAAIRLGDRAARKAILARVTA